MAVVVVVAEGNNNNNSHHHHHRYCRCRCRCRSSLLVSTATRQRPSITHKIWLLYVMLIVVSNTLWTNIHWGGSFFDDDDNDDTAEDDHHHHHHEHEHHPSHHHHHNTTAEDPRTTTTRWRWRWWWRKQQQQPSRQLELSPSHYYFYCSSFVLDNVVVVHPQHYHPAISIPRSVPHHHHHHHVPKRQRSSLSSLSLYYDQRNNNDRSLLPSRSRSKSRIMAVLRSLLLSLSMSSSESDDEQPQELDVVSSDNNNSTNTTTTTTTAANHNTTTTTTVSSPPAAAAAAAVLISNRPETRTTTTTSVRQKTSRSDTTNSTNNNDDDGLVRSSSSMSMITTTTASSSSSSYQLRKTFFQRAQRYEKQGQWSTAMSMYRDILQLDDTDSYSHLALANLLAKQPPFALQQQQQQLPPRPTNNNNNVVVDDRSMVVMVDGAEAASVQFATATTKCPASVHLWQAWGLHEATVRHNLPKAMECFDTALVLDPYNPYVLHAYGQVMHVQLNNATFAIELWRRALSRHSTAALICSYGTWLVGQGQYDTARNLYETHIDRMVFQRRGAREQTEVYLQMAYLEERYYDNYDRASHWIDQALQLVPSNSLAQVAKARLSGRRRHTTTTTTTSTKGNNNNNNSQQKNKETTTGAVGSVVVVKKATSPSSSTATTMDSSATTTTTTTVYSTTNFNTFAAASLANAATDGRVYNAWAKLHVQRGRYGRARQILQRGHDQYPFDHSLLQAYGAVENKLGNVTGAKRLYDASLAIQLSAPCLVSLALLELQEHQPPSSPPQQQHTPSSSPETGGKTRRRRRVDKILPAAAQDRFEQAIAVDRRHGPAYNAYAKAMWRYTGNVTATRQIYHRGVTANCSDAASLYHGYAHFELNYMNNPDRVRELLRDGTKQFRFQHGATDSPHRDRAVYLFHTLGMLELLGTTTSQSNDGGQEHQQHQPPRPSDALAAFQQGMDYCGKSSPLLLGAALSYIKLGNYEEARTALERSVRRDPCHAQAWHAWGVFETRSGNLETAKILLECGVRKCPRYGALWEALAILKNRLGQVDEARVCFEKGIVAEPTRSTLFQNWAALENRQENYNAAKALITKALTMNKRSGGAWIIASEIERQLGNIGLSNLLLRRGIENIPTVPSLYRTLGENLVRDGKILEARQVFEQGLAVDPLYAPLYHSLAELEARLFNVAGLAALHKRTTELFNTNLLDRSSTVGLSSIKNNTGTGINAATSSSSPLGEQQQQQARKKYSFKVPRSVAVLAETIVGGQALPDYSDVDDVDDEDDEIPGRRSNRDIVGSLQMDEAFLKNVIYGRSGDPDDL